MKFSLKHTLLFMTTVAFVACSSPSSKSLRINIESDPATLDCRRARDLVSQTVIRMFFEGLTRMGPDEKPELAMAEKVEISPDGKTYTFYLRTEAKWTNGDPVDASDFVLAWKRVLDPTFPSDQAFQLYVLENAQKIKEGKFPSDLLGVEALSPHVLQVRLENPTPYFLELTSLPVFFPVNRSIDAEDPNWAQSISNFVCNGPFIPKSWRHMDTIIAVRSPTYWDRKNVRLDQIDLSMVDEATEFKMYEKSELDWAGSPLSVLPLDALATLKKSNELKVQPFLATYFIRVNVDSPVFSNPLMRKAFSYSISRSDIVEHVTQGGQIPATGLVPSSMGLQDTPYFKDGDTAVAQEYFGFGLKELQMTSEDLPQIALTYASSERNNLIAQTLQQNWRSSFGLDVTLEPLETKVFYERLSKKKYQLALGSWVADFNDPINFLQIVQYRRNGTNNTQWENTEYIELLNEAAALPDAGKRKELYKKAERILMDEMPIMPVFYYTMLYLKKDNVHDVSTSSMGNIDFKRAYID